MPSFLLALGAHAGFAMALAFGQSGCPLRMTSGSGHVGEAASGNVRVGAGIYAAMFDLRGDQLYDSQGQACRWTPLLQCGGGQQPDSGFAVDCDGAVHYNNQTAFHECGTGEQDQRGIYPEPKGVDCRPATLKADSCMGAGCSSMKPCPANLSGAFEFPHLIVPVDKAQPARAAGKSYFGEASPNVSSLFNFDIPYSDMGKTCSLVFLFPRPSRGETSPAAGAGASQLHFAALQSGATENSTYSTKPAEGRALLTLTAVPGNSYTIDSFGCPAGQQITFEMSAAGPTGLRYFQDYSSSPMGL